MFYRVYISNSEVSNTACDEQRRLMLRMRFREQQFSQKTIPKLVRTRERSTASWALLQVVGY